MTSSPVWSARPALAEHVTQNEDRLGAELAVAEAHLGNPGAAGATRPTCLSYCPQPDLATLWNVADLPREIALETHARIPVRRVEVSRIERASSYEGLLRTQVLVRFNDVPRSPPFTKEPAAKLLIGVRENHPEPFLNRVRHKLAVTSLGMKANDALPVPRKLIAEDILGEEKKSIGKTLILRAPSGCSIPGI